ncbi:T9SS type B sorting domain-containing protein [Mesonia aestuariivivens]|uniref:T9SS type B sorting domain-containing protein n=1 Tax=Mesonia aestuariivivens TaxID=2796128 RepID=A0ABS6W0L3_9FLAO|nr:T9SS type B sorting domain-containing protein [Mesonia aestuariivivens]MBW2961374.1 T9SS type B sorting domain-containing protein [Mesonia aestuariivivens]
MKKKLFYLILIIPHFFLAQGEANYWYFGVNAGVNFNTSPPTAITNGQLNTNEGCSSISDESGNLLFYTDGSTIWNRDHQIMSNANYFNGNGLNGDPSSTSSGLIVPHPTNPNLYYVFTVDEPHHDNADTYPNQGPGTPSGEYSDLAGSSVPQDDDGFNNGLNYSIVDMSLDGGLGDVITTDKNVHLITYNPSDSEEIKYKCSEKITAVKGSDCNSIWLVTHFIDKFYAFKIDNSGISPTPVVSEVGPTIPISSYRRAAIGYIKISPNGKKLLIAHNTRTYNQIGSNAAEDGGVYLYDFDDATGIVSNNISLVENVNPYGVEFSMETKKAYATATSGNSSILYQWDLEATDISRSITIIPGVSTRNATALQLAPNGKIYKPVISTSKLAVINNPELDANQVNYSENISDGAIELKRIVNFGLPPFIQSIFSSRVNIIDETSDNIYTNLDLCEDEIFTLTYSQNFNNSNTYTWSKEGSVLPGETTESLEISANTANTFPYSETYKLEIDLNDGSCPIIGIANVTFHSNPTVTNTTLTQCPFSDENTSIFDLTNARDSITSSATNEIEFYKNLNEAQSNLNLISNPDSFENTTNPQTIIAKISSEFCSSYAEIELNVSNSNLSPINLSVCSSNGDGLEIFNLRLAEDDLLSLDPNFSVRFYENDQDAVLEENEITNSSSYQNSIAFEQKIVARVDNEDSCEAIIPINLFVKDIIPINEDEEIIYCLENLPSTITLGTGIPESIQNEYTYLWEPSGETTSNISTNNITTHTVTVTSQTTRCTATKTINLIASSQAVFQVEVDGFSDRNTVEVILDEDNTGDYEFSIDDQFSNYQEEPVFQNLNAGEHRTYVKDLNGCGITYKDFDILGIMKFFTPNQDGINDTWNLLGRNPENTQGIEIFIFDRFGKLLTSINPQGRGWNGSYNGKNMPSNDYWYLINLPNGKKYRGSFTLKR